jgi:uncharacterized protein YdaU (DUF1376 family)
VATGWQLHRYEVPSDALRIIAALVMPRKQVIMPVIASVFSLQQGRTPWTRISLGKHAKCLH